jgi:hypothetical protein
VEAIPASGQLDLVLCLLAERVDRTGAFAADNAVSMAAWTRGQAHSSHRWASDRVNAGRALVDVLPLTLAAWQRAELTLEHAPRTSGARSHTGVHQQLCCAVALPGSR